MKHAPLIRRAAKEEGEGGSGGDGCAGQGVWRTQETHCRLDGAHKIWSKETYYEEGTPGVCCEQGQEASEHRVTISSILDWFLMC